jgi:hypothetical protein
MFHGVPPIRSSICMERFNVARSLRGRYRKKRSLKGRVKDLGAVGSGPRRGNPKAEKRTVGSNPTLSAISY